jgi:uncharacterized membrane protein
MFWQDMYDTISAIKSMNTQTSAAFSVDEVLKASWAMTKKNWKKYLILFGCVILVYIAYGIAFGILDGVIGLPRIVDSLLSSLVGVCVSIFAARGALAIARDEKLDVQALGKIDGKTFLQALLAMILFYIVVAVGFVLLIIPGIIAGIMFSFYIYSIVDKQTEAIQALEDSMHMTRGNKLNIFFFNLALGLIAAVAIGAPSIITFLLLIGTGADLPFGVMVVVGILFAAVALVLGILLGMVGMSGQAYMYLKMRAKTPLQLKK